MNQGCDHLLQPKVALDKKDKLQGEKQPGESSEEECVSSNTSLEEKVQHQDSLSKKSNLCSGLQEATHFRIKKGCTSEFIANITVVATSLFLAQLVFRENGVSSEQLYPFINFSWLWIFSLVGGYIVRLMHLPSLLGMLAAGILTSNVGNIHVPEHWRAVCTSAGLAIILLRSGLELDLESVKKTSMMTMRLTCIPGCVEASICGVCAMLLFGMPFWLGLSLGFILAAVSPAVVVSGMLNLQSQGYGVDKGIPSLVIAAASFDDIFAIGGFSICIALAIKGEDTSILYSAMHGPISIMMGIILGLLTGSIMSLTKLWDTAWKRTVMVILIALTLMFGMKALSYPGSGAMGAITFGVVTSFLWDKQDETSQKKGKAEDNGNDNEVCGTAIEKSPRLGQSVEYHISIVWELIFEPLLFGCIGSALNFTLIAPETVAKSIVIVSLGSSLRLLAAFFSTAGNELSIKERCFISLAWLPKATVQAALCSFPLQLVKETLSTSDDSYHEYLEWGEQILSTAILSICMTAPLGVISIKFFGKKWLNHRVDEDCDRREVRVENA